MERPKIQLPLSATDKLVEVLGYLTVVAIWGLAVASYASLPAIIPTHYNGAGTPNGFGDKSAILTLPLVATVLFGALTALSRYPHILNYPTAITPANAAYQYTNATKLLRYLKLVLVVVFGLITFRTIQTASKAAHGLGTWFLPVSLGLIFIPLLFFIIKAVKAK